ncbi:hypothetical protein HanPSC8_Chr10g0428221 [Helianthus annuus]|nr:hypothetical protein HanPSC8_Chr10g0428221 [Helianthus annuus]
MRRLMNHVAEVVSADKDVLKELNQLCEHLIYRLMNCCSQNKLIFYLSDVQIDTDDHESLTSENTRRLQRNCSSPDDLGPSFASLKQHPG